MKRWTLWIALGAVLFIGLLTYLSLDLKKHRAEVCMQFQGRTNCRTALGSSREQAIRTATENACALIAAGMTDSLACEHSKPVSIKVLTSK